MEQYIKKLKQLDYTVDRKKSRCDYVVVGCCKAHIRFGLHVGSTTHFVHQLYMSRFYKPFPNLDLLISLQLDYHYTERLNGSHATD